MTYEIVRSANPSHPSHPSVSAIAFIQRDKQLGPADLWTRPSPTRPSPSLECIHSSTAFIMSRIKDIYPKDCTVPTADMLHAWSPESLAQRARVAPQPRPALPCVLISACVLASCVQLNSMSAFHAAELQPHGHEWDTVYTV